MSRITKQIATEVAEKLMASRHVAIEKLKKERQEYIVACYLTLIPKDVQIFFTKFGSFCKPKCSVYVHGVGVKAQYIQFGKSLPDNNKNLLLEDKEADAFIKFEDAICDAKKDYKKLFLEIEAALYGYRTYKKVEENFPEAYALLPKTNSCAVMINISSIRCQLDSSNCDKTIEA